MTSLPSPPQVSVFVDGDRRATGKFVGRRLCPRSLSPAISNLSEEHTHPSPEPLRLGSRGARDYWRGQLCGMRVWGTASAPCDVRRKMGSIPSASFVRAPPPPLFKVTVPESREGVQRLRIDAPSPDPSEDVVDPSVTGICVPGAAATKAYYEVSLRGTVPFSDCKLYLNSRVDIHTSRILPHPLPTVWIRFPSLFGVK